MPFFNSARRVIDRSHDRPGQTIYDWRHYLAVVMTLLLLCCRTYRLNGSFVP